MHEFHPNAIRSHVEQTTMDNNSQPSAFVIIASALFCLTAFTLGMVLFIVATLRGFCNQ